MGPESSPPAGAAEEAFTIPCGDGELVAILHRAPAPRPFAVVVVVGAPQYRVGSHRQFVQLARHLAGAGIPALRFDYRGMGDSTGEAVAFQDTQPDLRAALDGLWARAPGLEKVVLWGLCDGATAAALYAPSDERVAGLVLMNPWVREDTRHARIVLRHYYARRLLSRDFWAKLGGGKVRLGEAVGGLARTAAAVARGRLRPPGRAPTAPQETLAGRLLAALEAFGGPVLTALSGRDLVAREFEDAVTGTARWRRLTAGGGLARVDLAGADHTCSAHRDWHRMMTLTEHWVARVGSGLDPQLSVLPRAMVEKP